MKISNNTIDLRSAIKKIGNEMFHFVANLKDYTFYRGSGIQRFDSYLLSIDYIDSFRTIATETIKEGRCLVADNGNYDLISQLIDQNRDEANNLNKRRYIEEKKSSVKYIRPGGLSQKLQYDYQVFAQKLASISNSAISDSHIKHVVSLQTSLCPSYLIGMEDLTTPCLLGLNIEPEYSMMPQNFYDQITENAIQFATETTAGKYGNCNQPVFATTHAIDFDTAFQAGLKAGRANCYGIATGMAGALQDKNFIDFTVRHGHLHMLDTSIPRPYLRVLEIAAGLHLGYATVTQKRPRFHALGIGTPILLPLISLLGNAKTFTATDSTAPIVDAWTAPTTSLYVDQPAPLKLKTYKIAQHWIENDIPWSCKCPYCRNFNSRYPSNIREARNWWQSEGYPKLSKYSLYRNSPLSEWLPLLSNSADPIIQKEAALARVGHNHWVLRRIENQIRIHSHDSQMHRDWVEEKMQSYLQSSASSSWKDAALQAWKVASQASIELNEICKSSSGANKSKLSTYLNESRISKGVDMKSSTLSVIPNNQSGLTETEILRTASEVGKDSVMFADAQRWDKLVRLAATAQGVSDTIYHALAAKAIEFSYISDYWAEMEKNLAKKIEGLQKAILTSQPDQLRSFKEELERHLDDTMTVEQFIQFVEGFEFSSTKNKLEKTFKLRQDSLVRAFKQMKALHCRCVFTGNFRMTYQAAIHSNLQQKGEVDLKIALDHHSKQQHFFLSSTKMLYEGLNNEIDMEKFVEQATSLERSLSAMLNRNGKLLAMLVASLPTSTQHTNRRDILELVIEMEKYARMLSLLSTYVASIIAETTCKDANRWYYYEKRRAQKRNFESQVPEGQVITIAELLTTNDIEENQMVQIEGEVSSIEIVDDPAPPKFSTFIKLTDPTTGVSIQVRAHMFSLQNNGISIGTYCRINGFFRKSVIWCGQNVTGVDIDRVALGTLRRDSWIDDIIYRMRGLVRIFPDDMNMFFVPTRL